MKFKIRRVRFVFIKKEANQAINQVHKLEARCNAAKNLSKKQAIKVENLETLNLRSELQPGWFLMRDWSSLYDSRKFKSCFDRGPLIRTGGRWSNSGINGVVPPSLNYSMDLHILVYYTYTSIQHYPFKSCEFQDVHTLSSQIVLVRQTCQLWKGDRMNQSGHFIKSFGRKSTFSKILLEILIFRYEQSSIHPPVHSYHPSLAVRIITQIPHNQQRRILEQKYI